MGQILTCIKVSYQYCMSVISQEVSSDFQLEEDIRIIQRQDERGDESDTPPHERCVMEEVMELLTPQERAEIMYDRCPVIADWTEKSFSKLTHLRLLQDKKYVCLN